jgi:hypothetical protein
MSACSTSAGSTTGNFASLLCPTGDNCFSGDNDENIIKYKGAWEGSTYSIKGSTMKSSNSCGYMIVPPVSGRTDEVMQVKMTAVSNAEVYMYTSSDGYSSSARSSEQKMVKGTAIDVPMGQTIFLFAKGTSTKSGSFTVTTLWDRTYKTIAEFQAEGTWDDNTLSFKKASASYSYKSVKAYMAGTVTDTEDDFEAPDLWEPWEIMVIFWFWFFMAALAIYGIKAYQKKKNPSDHVEGICAFNCFKKKSGVEDSNYQRAAHTANHSMISVPDIAGSPKKGGNKDSIYPDKNGAGTKENTGRGQASPDGKERQNTRNGMQESLEELSKDI